MNQPAQRGGPTDPAHDARLRRGIIDTEVSRPVAWALVVLFLLAIYGVPLLQRLLELRDDEPSALTALVQRAPNRENLRTFEDELEQASYCKAFVQPRLQLLLSQWGGVGNKRVVIGRNGFLFYTPGVEHLSGASFIAKDAMARRIATEIDATPHPDPRTAILAFHRMLARRGITLVLFPVPDKTMLQPMQLHGRADASRPIEVARNPGFYAFVNELRASGVSVFDPTPAWLLPGERDHFLIQDTHWTPEWMEQVAAQLARAIETTPGLPPPADAPALHGVAQPVERVGDLVDMLKLPDEQALFRPEAVTVHQVQDSDGEPWEPDRASDVLLLGDSFTNVFSMDSMEWGEAAGLAPQLALALGRGIDVIAQNDSGAFATRQALARELGAGEDRLAGKRVVIWEFAARELSVGDWRPIDWSDKTAGNEVAR